jgi:hypothetical protein
MTKCEICGAEWNGDGEIHQHTCPRSHSVHANPFETVGNKASQRQQPPVKKVKQPMVPSPLERKLYDQSQQLKRFREWKREIRSGLLTGDYAPEITQLLKLLRKLPEPDVIVRFIQDAQWLRNGSAVMRHAVFEYVDAAMIRWRVRHGLPSFDDGLPDEPPSAFVTIRRLLAQEGV